MIAPPPTASIAAPEPTGTLANVLGEIPDSPAVFLLWPRQGAPYLGKTSVLRRRLNRLLRPPGEPSRFLNLYAVARRLEYWLAGSPLDASLVFYLLARQHFPDSYREMLRLRPPAYVKLIQSNRFPRTQVTTRLGGARALYYGPFRARAAAEEFESQFLDLFQLRRCQEDLVPSPGHPGCIYGEMNKCPRPCQQAVSEEEYLAEAERGARYLTTGGKSLLGSLAAARDRFSEQMQFEEAARQHKRMEKIQEALRAGGELARDIDHLHGVAVTRSVDALAVDLWFVLAGCWQPVVRFGFKQPEGQAASLDQRLREVAATLSPCRLSSPERQEHLALLARWHDSSWREGEWLAFPSLEELPYRKLVRAISRVAAVRS